MIARLTLAVLLLIGSSQSGLATFCGLFDLPCWSTATRPPLPGAGTFGYNTDANVLEFYNGTAWTVSIFGSGTVNNGTINQFTYYAGTGNVVSGITLGQNRIVLGGGAVAAPSVVGSLGTTTQVLHGNAAGAPSFSAVNIINDTSGTLTTARGGTGQTTFTANLPLIGNGGSAISQGTRSGNTTVYGTTNGALTSGNCAKFDASGNIIDFGGACGAGGVVVAPAPQGRLTLTSATPIMTTDVAGATSIFYTPAAGNVVGICDGTSFVPTTFGQLTNTTTDATKNPAAVAASKIYDLFVWNDAGTVRLGRGPAWTNDTTRGAGTALVLNTSGACTGYYMNNAGITNGPAASRGTYVGSVRSNAGSTIDVKFGGVPAAGGNPGWLGVYNTYNQSNATSRSCDSNGSWTSTFDGSLGLAESLDVSTTNRVSFLQGLADNAPFVSWQTLSFTDTTAGSTLYAGFGLDTAGAAGFTQRSLVNNGAAFSNVGEPGNVLALPPQLGFHYVQALQATGGTGTASYVGVFCFNQNLVLSLFN